MTIIVGQAGLDLPISGFTSVSMGAGLTTVTANIDLPLSEFGGDADERAAAYEALAWIASRYPCSEEPIVPVVATGDRVPHLNAFFRNPSIDVSREITDEANHIARVQISGQRVAARPLIDARCISTYRATSFASPSGISRLARMAFPPDTLDFGAAAVAGWTWTTVETEDGDVVYVYSQVTTPQFFDLDFTVAPDKYYLGAVRIEQQLAGGSRWTRCPGLDIEYLPGGTRLSNGRTRLTLLDTGRFEVEAWDPDANDWCAAREFRIVAGTLGAAAGWNTVEARHNRPELGVLSCTLGITGWSGDRSRVNVDFELRRGDGHVAITCTSAATTTWALDETSADTSALHDTDKGLIASSADAGGNKWMILTTDGGATLTTSTGQIVTVSAEQTNFGVGFETGASVPLTAASIRREYFGARLEVDRVAVR